MYRDAGVLDIPDESPKELKVADDSNDMIRQSMADGFTHALAATQLQNGVTYDAWSVGTGLNVATLLIQ
jgi:hypothetical protein